VILDHEYVETIIQAQTRSLFLRKIY